MRSGRSVKPLRLAALLVSAAAAACAPASSRSAAAAAPSPASERARTAATYEPHITERDRAILSERNLMVPVAGIRPDQVRDNYHARRGSRIHAALDILAPRGTPVVAADDGRILRLSHNPAGGIVIYAVDPDERFVYYYAHLERRRRGIYEGMNIAKGDVIGYVGTTGNAPRNVPHLHFQVMKMGPGRRWWDGEPVNPHPYFRLEGKTR